MGQPSGEALESTAGIAGPAFRLRCWGDFAIVCTATGRDLRPRSRKARALLAFLALHPGRAIGRERLAGLLWGDRGDEQARASLRQAIAELKAFTGASPSLIIVDREALMLDGTQLDRDIDAIGRAVAERDATKLAALRPDDDERLFANLDDIDEGFDTWLAIERSRQGAALEALFAGAPVAAGPAAPNVVAGATAPPPASRRWPWVAGAVAALVVVALAALFVRPVPAPATAEAPIAVAVMPFASLAPGDQAYFAEGVSEEILGQLARNPGLKVLGRTSAWSLRGEKLDAPAIGRKLAVDYLVEGSVRAAGDDVRIDVALVRTSDGARIWAEQYPGRLDDVFAIQDRIGKGVAAQLSPGARLAGGAIETGQGEVYRLYLQARGMLRDLEPSRVTAATALLRRAVALDPDFAPAQAALAYALLISLDHAENAGQIPAARKAEIAAQARALAEQALVLKPDLAEAHRIIGYIETTTRGQKHFEAAVRHGPNDAENWMALGMNYSNAGDYPRALDAFRRAVAIDPLWWAAFFSAAQLAWEMGYPEEAEAYLRRVEVGGTPLPFQAHMVRGDTAWRRGDFSRQYEEARKALASAPPENRYFAKRSMSKALRAAGRYGDARRIWRHYPLDDLMWRMWNGAPPTPAEVQAMIADPVCCATDERMIFMLRRLLIAGRTAEIVRVFDRAFGSPAALLARDTPGPMTRLDIVPLFAIALRREGRGGEATQMLDGVEAQARTILARGQAPNWYIARHAYLLAAMGRGNDALTALETGIARGWIYAGNMSLASLADEPALAGIRDTPRFKAISAGLDANIARERREIDRIIASGAAPPTI